ncbi:MAG: hypothetical protein JST68_31425, partial [Bacteroidetes bacterium]|nr:hypothetical protein [Bacteroidota bacterium]
MIPRLAAILSCLFFCLYAPAQTITDSFCAQQSYTQLLLQQNPDLRAHRLDAEKAIATRQKKIAAGTSPTPLSNGPVVLPVVVHIIHNNGPENISDLQVQTAIQHLNEAYANTGYYDPSDGVSTNIQFCLASRDPNNNPTNGITRDVSVNTVMDPDDPLIDD